MLILSEKDIVNDRVKALNLGADDYLIKPFSFEELLARMRTLIRRKYLLNKNIVKVNDIAIDLRNKIVRRNGKVIEIPPREYSLLEYLALNKGKVISRRVIEEHIYGENSHIISNAINAAICVLRKCIDKRGKKSVIKTKRSMGFIIEG